MKITHYHTIAFILPVLTFITCSCNSKSDNVSGQTSIVASGDDSIADPIVLNVDITTARPFESHFPTASIFTIDENDKPFMGRPESMSILGDTIYAVDGFHAPGFYAYKHDGSKIFHYCSAGGGPEDVNQPRYIAVNDSTISAFTSAPPSIAVIDRHGKFVKRIELPFTACGAMLDPAEGYWVNFSNQEDEDVKLAWYANETSQPTVALKVPEHLKGMTTSSTGVFQNLGDGTLNYMDLYEPRIYSLRNGRCRIKYELDFNGLWPDDNTIKSRYGGDSWANKSRDFPVFGLAATESDKWLAVTFRHNGLMYVYLYDKTSNRGSIYVDKDKSYSYPKYINGSRIYMPRQDDTIEILDLSTV
ncbi:MAG: 6-bladed beta-propeller [Paramuribaculum sp.]|nr:6-bladed beta-propeller [Paramuribaculum sp.]